MPELVEQMYCSQQIVIPPKFPYILKRYCKAAIKTQPYDLLRWSFEYFKALAEHRPPPVKLRLEYPVYSTEGGLTRGCLKVLACQLAGMTDIPLPVVKAAWGGFCLDSNELKRILCLCEVYLRSDTVPFLHFIAVAGGLLTKSLTQTMILLCESLTKEPDGGSAAIPMADFTTMYRFLASIDASQDVKYYDGFREGFEPEPEILEEQEEQEPEYEEEAESSTDDFWMTDPDESRIQLQRLSLINDHVAKGNRISMKMTKPPIGKIERSPSVERAAQIERENYLMERREYGETARPIFNEGKGDAKSLLWHTLKSTFEFTGRPSRNVEIDKKLKQMSHARILSAQVSEEELKKTKTESEAVEKSKEGYEIYVYNEDDVEIPYEFYGQPNEDDVEEEEQPQKVTEEIQEEEKAPAIDGPTEEAKAEEVPGDMIDSDNVALLISELYRAREDRLEDLQRTFEQIAALVDKYKTVNYDLGMVAGRQMSTTSGEFIVQHIEKEILAYIDEQIAVLPDPDLKKKKAKPEEVEMVRNLLETFLDENIEIICPEVVEVEEEETPIPEVIIVYAVPGIGPPVDEELIKEFEKYALNTCKEQHDFFMPRNVRHFLCPPMEKYTEHDYEDSMNKEQVPKGDASTNC